ncbi:tRNA (adenosine(37)-N6)-dimethylallyltransferase MiaA [Fructobacillus durionis]|uniref:tRNA dimethylallyltransferase n=1 Tax=Fructobacillus durionis TaxID=283737 RepID=A0A1I1EZZ9_9LACO|nr:tRNA (adenosine(37)-N6)-dimethylallyltransferase MiaA [Fructobacillus durionis]SFB92725.1 tRNA dimethylallyltransferase [Fructobacillus durionis]
MKKIKVIVIAGPTASGKSDLAMDLAEKYNGELISADSLQVYKQLDIGTAKASKEELKRGPQHLIDIVPFDADYSVADFVEDADEAIEEVVGRGKVPIIVGGTGFYIKALLGQQQLDFAPSVAAEVAVDQQKDLKDLVSELKNSADSELVSRVDLHNKSRVIRALQIARHGSKDAVKVRPEYDSLVLAIDWPREVLYERINQRVYNMVEKGLEQEARLLYNAGGLNVQAGRGIGYKEFYPYFDGNLTLEQVIEDIQQDSRRYAKRQLTYWRHQIEGLEWIAGDNREAKASARVHDFLLNKE